MKFRIALVLLMILILGGSFRYHFIFSCSEAYAASANYKTASGIFDSGSALSSSSSFRSIGKARGIQLSTPSSINYIIGEGFLRTAYFKPAALAPIVTSITPNNGLNTGLIKITDLTGANFQPNATVKLTMAGETDILANNINVVSASKISCQFELAARKIGKWDLVVINPDLSSGTLPLAFTIGTWTQTNLVLNDPNPFNPSIQVTTVMYKLAGDTGVTLAIFNTSGELIWKRVYPAGSNGGKAGDNNIVWTGLSDFNELASNGVYLVHVIDNSSGKTLSKGKIAVIRR